MQNRIILSVFLSGVSLLISQSNPSYNGALKTAKMLEREGEIDAAISIYRDILEKKPTHYQSFSSLKSLYQNNQKYKEGIQLMRERLVNSPNDTRVYLDLSEFYYLDDQKGLAKATWSSGLDKFQSSKTYYRLLISLLEKYSDQKNIDLILTEGRINFDKAFLAYESGLFHQTKREYDLAMDQFILHLIYQKKNSSLIEKRILIMSDEVEAQKIIEQKLIYAAEINPEKILNIISQFYFKQQKYELATKAKEKWTLLGSRDFKSWLEFAADLNEENQFKYSTYAYNFILNQNLNSKITDKALIGLAKTVEKQIITMDEVFLIPYFYDDNIFFQDQFISSKTMSIENLKSSLQVYDSLIISIKNPAILAEVYFRIGEVQFKVLQDFDKAYNLFNKALNNKPGILLNEKIKLRIADTFIAKGNLDKAKSFLKDFYKSKPSVKIKERILLVHLLTEEPDSSLLLIKDFLKETSPTNSTFNDLMELRTILSRYTSEKEEDNLPLHYFLRSEYFLRQKKTGNAIEELMYVLDNYPKSKITPLVNLRLSLLNYKIGSLDESLKFATNLEGSEYEDRGIILIGQIHEYKLSNIEKALENYMKIIDEFPNSIYSEPIRFHIRKIQKVKTI